jgi:hypothetical protein
MLPLARLFAPLNAQQTPASEPEPGPDKQRRIGSYDSGDGLPSDSARLASVKKAKPGSKIVATNEGDRV